MPLINNTDKLAQLCKQLADAPYITVDTEFMRERTYFAQLCLIQVASETEVAAIDTLAEGLDLEPFFELMNHAAPLKVFHACRQDLEIFYQLSSNLPNKVFDSQVAAMVCGFGESVGYKALVEHFTDGKIDKSARFTDWSRRPLSERQIEYALSDVTFLRDIYKGLTIQLKDNDRHEWIEEEMSILMSPQTYENPPELAWKRVKHRSRDKAFLGRLKAVAAWREVEAQKRNLPRNRIVRDETLLEMATHPPKEADDLAKMRGVSEKFAKGPIAKTLFQALDAATPLDRSELPAKPVYNQNGNNNITLDILKLLLKVRAKEIGVAPKLIANNDDLERVANNNDPERQILQGWRHDVFGRDACRLKNGEVALAINQDHFTLVPLQQDPA